MTVSFCDFVQKLTYQDLPEDVRWIMQRSLLDTIGVAAVGSRTKISTITQQIAMEHMAAGGADENPKSRMIFDGRVVSPTGAAMNGGFAIDSIDAHDGNSAVKGHAGSGVFPAVVAVADDLRRRGAALSGQDFITALAVGYEIAYRVGHVQHATCDDYHTSGAWTAVGAAAACGRLLGLDNEQLRHAVGIAEYHGPRSQMMRCIDHPTMLRDGVGWGSPAGVSAAYMAKLGFTGAPAITIEGEDDITQSFWSDLGDTRLGDTSLGNGWRIRETHYKKYPVCRWAHPAIDLADTLMIEHNLESGDIDHARITTFHNATRLAGHDPQTLDELTYGLAFPLAIMICKRRIGAVEVSDSILDDAEVRRMSVATEIVESKEYTEKSIATRWADVTLYLKDGRILQSEPATPRGDPENPLSDEEIHAKYHMLADPIIGEHRANDIEAMVPHVSDQGFELGALFDLILKD